MQLKPWSAEYLRNVVGGALEQADFELALGLIRNALSNALRAAVRNRQLSFGSRELDALCLEVGRRIAASARWRAPTHPPDSAGQETAPLDLFVASELYAAGGHTALLGDYMENLEGRQRLLALTNLSNRPQGFLAHAWPRLGIDSSETVICEEPDLEGKCRWLMGLLAERRPHRVFLFTHPHDSPALAACQPLWDSQFYFVHHTDRLPSLGAFSPVFAHVDVTPFSFGCCREMTGIRDNLYLPIVVADQGARDFSQPRNDFRGLLTAACGTANKFELKRSDLYGRAVAAILGTTGGRHLHIGDLSDGQLRRLRSMLRGHGIGSGRFMHIPSAPSLWRTLDEQRVDLYIGSLPVRGARASAEAMGSATPAIWHLSDERSRFHDTHMKYPEAAVWHDIDGLIGIIRAIDAQWLRRQSAAARQHYELCHHPHLLARQLSRPLVEASMPPNRADGPDEPRPIDLEGLSVSWRDRLRTGLVVSRSFWRGRFMRHRSAARRRPVS